MPPILFAVLTLLLMGVFGVSLWLAVLIGLVLVGAEYIIFYVTLNRWEVYKLTFGLAWSI